MGAGAEDGNGTSTKHEEAEETMSVRDSGRRNSRETLYVVAEMNEAEETVLDGYTSL